MGQYLQYRTWLRNSSRAEKALAATVALVVVTVTGLALVPAEDRRSDEVLAVEQAGGAGEALQPQGAAVADDGGTNEEATQLQPGDGSGALEEGGPASATDAGGQRGDAAATEGRGAQASDTEGGAANRPAGAAPTGSPAAPGPATRAAACSARPSAPGISATSIRIAVTTINLGGAIGNSAVGVASPEQTQQMSEAVLAHWNTRGGAACRKVVPTYFRVNPIDQNSARAACLQIAEGGFFAVVDLGGFAYPPGAADCVAQRKIPVFSSLGPTPSQSKQYAPYELSVSYDPTVAARNSILGLHRTGWFSPSGGFKKLGLYQDDCYPEVNDQVSASLTKIGISKRQISLFSFSCPGGGFASPSDASAAVVKHRQDGVTHVLPITGMGSFKGYSNVAAQQRFKPQYTLLDLLGAPMNATTATGPDRDNFDGALIATTAPIGMQTSGLTSPGTDACKSLFSKAKLDPAWVFTLSGGTSCNSWQVLFASLNKAPGLKRTDLALGLGALGRVSLSYPSHDAVYKPGKWTANDFWWVSRYSSACNCWKVVDRTLRPTFP